MAGAIALIAYVAPEDANQGLSQRIFYFHVPIALTAYVMFIWGAWKALLHLWRREPGADLESYVAIHLGVIFGVLTLVTGSIATKLQRLEREVAELTELARARGAREPERKAVAVG